MTLNVSKNTQLYSKLSIYVVSNNMPSQFGDANHRSWSSYNLGHSYLRLQLDQALVETLLDIRHTTEWFTGINTKDKWSKIWQWGQLYIHIDLNHDVPAPERRGEQRQT